jgi:uncharacterized protein
MTFAPVGRTLLTLLIGSLGAAVAWAIGFPAPFLTGPATAVTTASLFGFDLSIERRFREVVFMFLGIAIGQTVTPEVISAAARWPVSLICLGAMLLVIIVTSRALLTRFWHMDGTTALMSAFPGHLSYVLGISEGIKADLPVISLVQSVRVLALTLLVPLIVTFIGELPDVAVEPVATLSPVTLLIMLATSAALGWVFRRIHVPAPYLMGGIVLSALLHGSEAVSEMVPPWLAIAAFISLGSMIGTRFSGISFADLRRSLTAGLVVTGISAGIAALFAFLASFLTGFPIPMLLIAFAPGGVETMVAISVVMGMDPTFVAAHHVSRLLMLTFIVPVLLIGKERN